MAEQHSGAGRKYVVIHGHFYQPPRENPWLNYVELEPTARPAHDWNERIARECYIPNGVARINDHKGNIVDLVNNYEYLSFDFGPTLLNWYQTAFPESYARIITAFEKSRQRLGHGNAIAHGYNHIILPLASFKDKLTQILWGIADFEHRFKARPEALWLPETACNADVLKLLIDQRMRYVILAPSQAEKIRRPGGAWLDVSGENIDTRRVYFWQDKDENGNPLPGRAIAVFFYDGPVSKSIAFENAMKNSASAAERFMACFDQDPAEDQLVHVATDGESYGHHQKFADLTLAHLFRHEFKNRNVHVTNYGAYLDAHPPVWEVQIKPGADNEGTAWSCSHGVNRWQADCGCGREGSQHQLWRAPLREALDWLRDTLGVIFEKEGAALFANPWEARNGYISVIMDRSEANIAEFIKRYGAGGESSPDKTAAALKLLEMQKNAMFMYTSCGWFFSEVSRIETVQNLKYAARAIELAAEFGYHLDDQFAERLRKIPSNLPEFARGNIIYEKLVRPSFKSWRHIVAEYAMRGLFENPPAGRFYCYSVAEKDSLKKESDDYFCFAGTLSLKDDVLRSEKEAMFCCVLPPDCAPVCYAGPYDAGGYAGLKSLLAGVSGGGWESFAQKVGGIISGGPVALSGLVPEARLQILDLIHNSRLDEFKSAYTILFKKYLPLVEQWHNLALEIPEDLKAEASLCARYYITTTVEHYLRTKNAEELRRLCAVMPVIRKLDLAINSPALKKVFNDTILASLDNLETSPDAADAAVARQIVAIAVDAGVTHWLYDSQNRALRLFENWEKADFAMFREESGRRAAAEILQLFKDLRLDVGGIVVKLQAAAGEFAVELNRK